MRVLIVDDHPLFRDGIAGLLEAAGFEVIGQVGDGQLAYETAKETLPDLILMDISMPRLNGLQALKKIKADLPSIRVVMLTVISDDETLLEAIQAGADGYLLKILNTDEFLANLQSLNDGALALSRHTATRLIQQMVEKPKKPATEAGAVPLTNREIDLLQWLSQGMSNKEIAAHLSVSENTVKYHIKNILQKLGVQNRTEAVAYAVQRNLTQPPKR